jgi:hypothetical protein
MESVDFVGVVLFVYNENHTSANRDKVWVRNSETAPVREPDCERLEIGSEPFPDVLEIQHTRLFLAQLQNVNRSKDNRLCVVPISPQRGLRLRLFHEWGADLLAQFDELDLAHRWEAGASRDQMPHDHVFLETAQPIDFA